MAAVGSVVVNFKANTADFSKGVKQVKGETEQLGKSLKSGGGFMAYMKENFGKKSDVGQIATMLKGAGVVAGLNLVGKQLEHFSAKMLEIKEAAHSGAMSWQQMTREIAKSIPLVGNFIEAGGNFAELFVGRDAAENQLKTESERMAINKQIIEDNKKAHRQSLDIAKFEQIMATGDLHLATVREEQLSKATEFDKQRLRLAFELTDELVKVGNHFEDMRAFAGEDQKQIEDITRLENKRYKEIEKQLQTKLKIIDAAEFESNVNAGLPGVEAAMKDRQAYLENRQAEFARRMSENPQAAISERRTAFTVMQAPIANEEDKKQTGILQDIADSLEGSGVTVVGLEELT